MKKLFTLIGMLLGSGVLFASQRLVMVEEFTNASCPPCATQNPAFNTLLNANPVKVVALKYQTDWPGRDPMNAHNPGEVDTRVAYYGVTGVPHALFDGVALTGGSYTGAPANATQTKINNAYAVPSSFTMTLSHSFSASYDSIHITGSLTCTQSATGTFVLRVALMERNILFTAAPGSNGELHFEGVMKKMLPNANGTTLSNSWTVGQTQNFNFDMAMPWNVYNLNELAVVAFIQNNANKSVQQAVFSAPIGGIATTNNAALSSVNSLPFLTCTGTYNPNVVIRNMVSTALTTADILYYLDGVLLGSIPWSGSLNLNQSATIAIPTVTVTGIGNHLFTFKVANPNGAIDYVPINDTYNKTIDFQTGAVPAPVTESFAPVSYPPAGWGIENVGSDDYTWARSAAGFNGQGSSKMDFFSAISGRVDNLLTPTVDLTNAISMSTLEFDVAYAQFATSLNDRLKVNVSSDCGSSWVNLFDKAGTTLATAPPNSTTPFAPSGPSQWRHEVISLSNYAGQSNLIFQFNAISANGNNLYIDNVNITTGTVGIAAVANEANSVSVYPNPTEGTFFVNATFDQPLDIMVRVTNPLGEVVKSVELKNTSSGSYPVDLTREAKGNYFVNISAGNKISTTRIVVTH